MRRIRRSHRVLRSAKHAWIAVAALSTLLAVPGSGSGQDAPAGDSTIQSDSGAADADRVSELLAELRSLASQIARLEERLAAGAGAQSTLFEFQRRTRWSEHHDRLLELGSQIERIGLADVDSASLAAARGAIRRELAVGEAWVVDVQNTALAQLDSLYDAPPEDLVEAEVALGETNADLDALMVALAEDYDLAGTLGMPLDSASAVHDSTMVDRTELLAAALEYAHDRIGDFRTWLDKPGVDTVAVRARISAMEERIVGTTESLRTMSNVLDRRDVDTSRFRTLIVATSGAITTEVLDTRVLGTLLAEWTRVARDWFMSNVGAIVLRVGLIVLVLLAAARLARFMRSAVQRGLRNVEFSALVKNLVVSGASKLMWVIGFVVILAILGVDLGPMLAGLGIVGFVVGFALQETLANFASGMMIMVYRPFDVGDFVTTAGVTGKVKDLTLVSTVIQTLDNKRIIVPNGKVWGDVINNATAERIRRVDLVFGISYSDDIDHARKVLEDVVAEDERVLENPEPMVRVESLGDSSVNLFCRPWCRTEDYWEVYWDLTGAVKKRFDAEGISIPFPQRDVHLFEKGGTKS